MHPKEKLLLFQDVPQISIFSKIAFDKTFYCTHITFKLIYVPMYFCFKNLYSKGKKRAPSKCGFCKTLLLYECISDQLPTFFILSSLLGGFAVALLLHPPKSDDKMKKVGNWSELHL